MPAIPQSVRDKAELSPIEDIMLAVLRDGLPEVPVYSLIPEKAVPPFILVRRDSGMGDWGGDPRFIDTARVSVQTYTEDPDGDEQGAVLSEAIRVVLRDAGFNHTTIPGRGSILHLRMVSEPSRKTDWATSSGPVQFADLPTGFWRYESKYKITVRKAMSA